VRNNSERLSKLLNSLDAESRGIINDSVKDALVVPLSLADASSIEMLCDSLSGLRHSKSSICKRLIFSG
jgi:hypothetical protein